MERQKGIYINYFMNQRAEGLKIILRKMSPMDGVSKIVCRNCLWNSLRQANRCLIFPIFHSNHRQRKLHSDNICEKNMQDDDKNIIFALKRYII